MIIGPTNTCKLVLDWSCEAPANGVVSISTRCFACGEPVCRSCSRIVKYYNYGRCRVCAECIDMHSERIEEIPNAG